MLKPVLTKNAQAERATLPPPNLPFIKGHGVDKVRPVAGAAASASARRHLQRLGPPVAVAAGEGEGKGLKLEYGIIWYTFSLLLDKARKAHISSSMYGTMYYT